MGDVTIDCGNGNNGDTDVTRPGKITFHNKLNNKSISLNLPEKGGSSCFAPTPTSPVTIEAGEDAGPYNLSNNANGNYDYDWTVEKDPSAAPRTGRIVVG